MVEIVVRNTILSIKAVITFLFLLDNWLAGEQVAVGVMVLCERIE